MEREKEGRNGGREGREKWREVKTIRAIYLPDLQ